jgi:uncharacterized protein (DUF2267 family)
MTMTGLSAVDHTVHLTNEWLKQISDRLNWDNRQRAYRLLRVTLQTLRDWLSINEAADLGAQLPMLIRGIYYEGWNLSAAPAKQRSKADFVARVEKAFETDPIDNVEEALTAVFITMNDHITKGEVDDVRLSLRLGLRDIWPEDLGDIWPEISAKD